MNLKALGITVLTIALCATMTAQTAIENWVGIWHADVAGQPTSTLTLATDTGELGGTVVLDMICCEGETPHVIASDPHVLLNPIVVGNTLSFQVKMRRSDGSNVVASFEVKQTTAEKATIHCINCGVNAPVVELVKGL